LESIVAASAPGSEIVFDYRVTKEFIDPEDLPFVEAGDKRDWGEPKRSWFNPLTLPDEISVLGFDLIESLSPKQLQERYFAGRSDVARPATHQYYVSFRRR
jgi:O-methyltransferase involved in polyketide biosynthesis